MKSSFLFLLLFIVCPTVFSQSLTEEDGRCIEKCHLAGQVSRLQQVTYLQYASMDKYDVKYLKLDISAEPGSRNISGTALTIAKVTAPLDSFITELRDNMTVDSVFINGVKKTFTRSGDHVFVSLSPVLPVGNTVEALFYYRGTANSIGVFAGTVGSNGLNYTATLSESYQAREWFPAKQLLKDKIDSADIWITTSAVNKAGSNGLLQGVDVLPSGKVRYRWKTRYPMNYYMPSISVGNYMEYLNYAKPLAMSPDSILIQHYLVDNATYFNSVKANLDKTPPFIEKLSELYGLYPFSSEKYGHAHASIGGGMEHQTMSTMNSFGSTLIAHELAHQWWGDNVTCARWNDIWLNEGFASYSEYLLVENLPLLFPTTNAPAYMQSVHNNVMSSGTGSVYVPEASLFDEGRIFSGRLSYNKGSAILHTLRFEMQNDNLFFQTLQNFQDQFRDSVATAEDFKQVAEATSGKNFGNYFNQWYYGEGYPTFNITYFRPNSDSLLLLVNETVSAPAVTPFFSGLLQLTITSEAGDTTVLINLAANNQVFKFKTAKVPTGIIVDPNNWILNQTGTITNGIVVPVTFKNLEATAGNNCSYNIRWETEQDRDVSGYEVEYSADGTRFTTAGTVAVNNTKQYLFTYADASGKQLYFRIKTIDQSGQLSYSRIVSTDPVCNTQFSMSVYPNPVESQLTLNVRQATTGKVTVRLLNAAGQIIRKEIKTVVAGENKIIWSNMNTYPAATYLVQVENEAGRILSKKFVKR